MGRFNFIVVYIAILLFGCVAPQITKPPNIGQRELIERRPKEVPLWVENWGKFIEDNSKLFDSLQVKPFYGVSRNYVTESDAERDAYNKVAEKIARYLETNVVVEYQGITRVNTVASKVINPEIIEKIVKKEESVASVRHLFASETYVEKWREYREDGWVTYYQVWVLGFYPESEIRRFEKALIEKLDSLISTIRRSYQRGENLIEEGEFLPALNVMLEGFEKVNELGWRGQSSGIDFCEEISKLMYGLNLKLITPTGIVLKGENDYRIRILATFGDGIPVQGFKVKLKIEEGLATLSPDIISTNRDGIAEVYLRVNRIYSGEVRAKICPLLSEDLRRRISNFSCLVDALESLEKQCLTFNLTHEREYAKFKLVTDTNHLSYLVASWLQEAFQNWMVVTQSDTWDYSIDINSSERTDSRIYYGGLFYDININVKVRILKSNTGLIVNREFNVRKSAGTLDLARQRAYTELKQKLLNDIDTWRF